MEFSSYLDRDGYLKNRAVLKHGPIAPGTLLTYVPVVPDMQPRYGMIVGVHGKGEFAQVDVVWQAWREVFGSYDRGELRRKLGIPTAAEEERRKWDEKSRRRALECKAGLHHGTLGS